MSQTFVLELFRTQFFFAVEEYFYAAEKYAIVLLWQTP